MSKIKKPSDGQIIDAAELRELIPFSGSFFWRLENRGKFPKRIKLGDRRVGWDRAEVMAWLEAKKSER